MSVLDLLSALALLIVGGAFNLGGVVLGAVLASKSRESRRDSAGGPS